MQLMRSRRTMLKLIPGAGAAAVVGDHAVPSAGQAQASIDSGGIGLTRVDWEVIAGEGRETGDLVEYANPELDGFTVVAQFDESARVRYLEFGYEEGEGEAGGLPTDDVRLQIEGALPADATLAETFAISQVNRERTQFRIERFVSEQLGQLANGLASILVVTQERDSGFGTDQGAGTVTVRTTLTMPGPHTLEARETGNPGGIGLSSEAWTANYGEPEPTQGGDLYRSDLLPGFAVLVHFKPGDRANLIDAVSEDEAGSVPYASAKDFVASTLPEDATLQETFIMPPTPEGPIGLSAEWWECPSLAGEGNETGSVVTLFLQTEGDAEPEVTRVAIALPVRAG